MQHSRRHFVIKKVGNKVQLQNFSLNVMFVNGFYVGRGWEININNGDVISRVEMENREYTFSDLGSMPHHPNPGMVLTLA